jgi:hypothetical protein
MTQSNKEEEQFIYDPQRLEPQKAVVKIHIDDEEWTMEWEDYEKALSEGRTKPVIYKDKLILVDDETYDQLRILTQWVDKENNKKNK